MSGRTVTSTTDTPEQVADALVQSAPEPDAPPSDAAPATAQTQPVAAEDETSTDRLPEEDAASQAGKVLAERSKQTRFEKRQEQLLSEIEALRQRKEQAIAALVKQKAELAREAEELERRQAPVTPPPAPQPPVPAPAGAAPADSSDPEPVLEDEKYSDWDAWNAAHSRWLARQEARAILQAERVREAKERAEREAQETAQRAMSTHRERVAAFVAEHTDFETVIANPEAIVTPEMSYVLVNSPVGPALMYHLGQHPEESKRLASLSVHDMFREMGRLEAKFETPSAPSRPSSQAPAPITPVRSAVMPAAQGEISDYQKYKAARLAEQARARGQR